MAGPRGAPGRARAPAAALALVVGAWLAALPARGPRARPFCAGPGRRRTPHAGRRTPAPGPPGGGARARARPARAARGRLAALPGGLDEGTFLITTRGASERLTAATRTLQSFGDHLAIARAAAVRTFERDSEDGARGCYASHLAIYRDALARGLPVALIFEDNLAADPVARDGPLCSERLEAVLRWAAGAAGTWDVLHLSLVHSAAALRLCRVSEDAPVVRVERTAPDWYGPVPIERAPGLGTTAYLVSRRAMEAVVREDDRSGFQGVPIDDVLARRFGGTTFGAFPAPFHRGPSASLINPGQQAFRAVMFDPSVSSKVEQALVATGLSTSQLVWLVLGGLALWTAVVFVPLAGALLG